MLGFQPKYYALDTFNEVSPKSNDPDFLAKTSVALQTSLPKGSIWVMQGNRVSFKLFLLNTQNDSYHRNFRFEN